MVHARVCVCECAVGEAKRRARRVYPNAFWDALYAALPVRETPRASTKVLTPRSSVYNRGVTVRADADFAARSETSSPADAGRARVDAARGPPNCAR